MHKSTGRGRAKDIPKRSIEYVKGILRVEVENE